MRTFLSFLVLTSTLQCGLSQTTSPPPLSDGEKQQILRQLYELESARKDLAGYRELDARDKEQDEREVKNWQRTVELEKKATGLAERERDLAEERGKFYEAAYKSVTKRRGFGCTLLKIFTLGISGCH